MGRKVAELEGAELDYWVAKADPDHPHSEIASGFCKLYSTRWDCGGPIIERERITLATVIGGKWGAYKDPQQGYGFDQYGDTPLEAAMRCFVASKFGDEVPG